MSDLGCDVLVVGTGATGLVAAIAARTFGLDVLVVEKARLIGGTSALSGGWLWVPCSSLARRAGLRDSADRVREYLRHEIGDGWDRERIDAFLASGPEMVEFVERVTPVRFRLGLEYPDYHPNFPGGLAGGRAICPLPFDGRKLGNHLADLRTPPREMTLYGLKVGSGPDFHHFFNARRSWRSALYVARRVLRHSRDRLLHGRDLVLVSGNALVAGLMTAVYELGIPIRLETSIIGVSIDHGRVAGAMLSANGEARAVTVRKGVVLACGGFAHDDALRYRLFPRSLQDSADLSLTAEGATGDGVRIGESAGGYVDSATVSAAAWMPVSHVHYRDGTSALYPHSYERGKPGVICVDTRGQRFANESDSYHDLVSAMIRTADTAPRAYLVADCRFVRRYGLGIVRPFPFPVRRYVKSGYLKRARTLADLAQQIGVAPDALAQTVADFNRYAKLGVDPLFGRGENAYNRYQGDPAHGPNPCLAPIERAPYYAVELQAGNLGTFMGLRTDGVGNVLDERHKPIRGLYAVGNDMESIFHGHYPGPGANLGPGMTFAYRCARHLAARGRKCG
jgi:succinate dehydrogenase/fumarate reductase flavoprotein subunit